MTWHFSSGMPLYPQIVDTIVCAILSGEIAPGEKLPGVRELAMEAAVNPNTMQRAMAELESRGLVATQRTAGRIVTNDTEVIESERSKAAHAEVSKYLRNMESLGYSKRQAAEFAEKEAV